MKLNLAHAIAALTLVTAPVNAQGYPNLVVESAAHTAEPQHELGAVGFVWPASCIQVPEIALPDGTKLGTDLPIEIFGIVHFGRSESYLSVPALSIEVREIRFANAAVVDD